MKYKYQEAIYNIIVGFGALLGCALIAGTFITIVTLSIVHLPILSLSFLGCVILLILCFFIGTVIRN